MAVRPSEVVIRLYIDSTSLNSVRLTFSPFWEAIASLALLARNGGPGPPLYARWVAEVRADMPAELAGDLVGMMAVPDSPILSLAQVHIPDPSRNSITTELRYLRESDVQTSERTFDLIERYWQWAIAPYWSSIRASLEDEVLFRGRTLAVAGPEAMLAELGGRVSWSPPHMTAPYHRDLTRALGSSKLLLVPSVFARGVRMFAERDTVIAMSYEARTASFAAGLSQHRSSQPQADRLAILLGDGRARVLRSLERPKTTTEVAKSLGLAKSTVSQHLAVLTSAGAVWHQRIGGRVLYQLDHAGFALLEQLGH
jgi:DNA-binding transcriptional ArsR family regulator